MRGIKALNHEEHEGHKGKVLLCALRALRGSLLISSFCDALRGGETTATLSTKSYSTDSKSASGTGFNSSVVLPMILRPRTIAGLYGYSAAVIPEGL